MDKAAFRLDSYNFPKASIDFNVPRNATLNIAFAPSGIYYESTGIFELTFETTVTCEETKFEVIKVRCWARFIFQEPIKTDEIPDYFYPNSLAILFPYIRAFVSTISLQANVNPIMLPTINLLPITETLKNNTKVVQTITNEDC